MFEKPGNWATTALDAPPVVPPEDDPVEPELLLAVLCEEPEVPDAAPELLPSALVVEPVTSPLEPEEPADPDDPALPASAVEPLVEDEPVVEESDDPLAPAEPEEARFEPAFDAAWKPLT